MADTLHTWSSRNAPPGHEWMGFIYINGKRLNIIFTASTEEELKAKMREEWAKEKEVREANRARRAEAMEKRQERLEQARNAKKSKEEA